MNRTLLNGPALESLNTYPNNTSTALAGSLPTYYQQIQQPIGYSGLLAAILRFVRKVGETSCPGVGLEWRARGSRLQTRTTALTGYAGEVVPWFHNCLTGLEHCAEINAFLQACSGVGLHQYPAPAAPNLHDSVGGRPWYTVFNQLVEELRAILASREYKKKLHDRAAKCTRNYNDALNLVQELFEKRARLLVIRLDLGYLASTAVGLEEAKRDRTRLFNNLRNNKQFRGLLGCIWKMEYGEKKGVHYHMLFFFDGADRRQDVSIAHLIGQYWEEKIAYPHGTYYNCNHNKAHYQELGIGMIHRNEDHARSVLTNTVVAYLAKSDQSLLCKSVKREQTFGCWPAI